jgi:hypothetical protein
LLQQFDQAENVRLDLAQLHIQLLDLILQQPCMVFVHFERRGDAKPPARVFVDFHGAGFRMLYEHAVIGV